MKTQLNPLQVLQGFYEARVKNPPKLIQIEAEADASFILRGVLPEPDRLLASLCYQQCIELGRASEDGHLAMVVDMGSGPTVLPLCSEHHKVTADVFGSLLAEILYTKVPGSFRLAPAALVKDWKVFTLPHELSEGEVAFEPCHAANDFYPKLHRILSGEVIFDGDPELQKVGGREIIGQITDLTIQQIYTLGVKVRSLREKMMDVTRDQVERMYVWQHMLFQKKLERIASQGKLTDILAGCHLPLVMKKKEDGDLVSRGVIVCEGWNLVAM